MYLHEDKILFIQIREHRNTMTICPSADENVNVSNIIRELCDSDFFKEDYQSITNYFADDYVAYNDTVQQMKVLADLIDTIYLTT